MTLEINDRMRSYTPEQLEAVIEVLESFDLDTWNKDLDEYGLCRAPWQVSMKLNRARSLFVRRLKK